MSQATELFICFDQRKRKRINNLKKGKIIFNNGHSVLECTVCDTSENGAGLQLPCFVELPSVITLDIVGDAKRECEVMWFANNKLGVRYVDPSHGKRMESPRQLLLKRVRLIQDQLDKLQGDIETTLAP